MSESTSTSGHATHGHVTRGKSVPYDLPHDTWQYQSILSQRKQAKQEPTKDSHLNCMRLFASIVGYVLLLAQRLMRNTNLVNARPMLLLTKAAWYEQTLWVTFNISELC